MTAAQAADTAIRRRTAGGVLVLLATLLALHVPRSGGATAPAGDNAQLRLNPNTATRGELMLLPGVGPVLAQNIIDFREAADSQPAFGCAEDLDAVYRIGPVTVEKMRPMLCFDEPPRRIDPS